MIKLAFLPILLIAQLGLAKAKKASDSPVRKVAQVESSSPAANLFLQYLACRQDLQSAKDASWVKCIHPHTVEAPVRRRTFAEFLFANPDIKKLRECSSSEDETAKSFPDYKDISICFEYTEASRNRVGAAFISRVDGKLLLYSLYRFP